MRMARYRIRGDSPLGGYARQEIVLGQLNELNRLFASDRRKSLQELLQRGISFDVIDESLDRHASSLEARRTAEAVRVHPDDLIKQRSLFHGHTTKLSDHAEEGKRPLATRAVQCRSYGTAI